MPDRHPIRLLRASVLLLACLLSRRAGAQSPTSLLPDATVLPPRELRVRGVASWTRYDALLGDGPLRNIGSIVAVDSLGVAQVPSFAPIEAGIQAASGLSSFRLTAGNLTAPADGRVVVAPLILEYGVTRRLTVGVAVPLVEARTTVVARMNPMTPSGSTANVGPNPASLGNPAALGANTVVVQTVRDATGQLQARLTACTADPSGAGCAGLLGQRQSVETLIQTSGALTTTLENLYGTDLSTHPGQAYVPLANTPIQATINQRVQAIATQLGAFLGSTITVGNVAGANGPAGNFNLQQLYVAAGRDTLGSTHRTSIGDISIGATLQLLNRFGDTTGTRWFHPQYRVAVNGTFRIGTGQLANHNRALDVPTGSGQNGIVGGIAADARFGNHVSGTALASYTKPLGTVQVPRIPGTGNAVYPLVSPMPGTYSAGDLLQLSVIPRIRLAGYFALTGEYSMLRAGADQYAFLSPIDVGLTPPPAPFGLTASTAHQVGFGFSYSTIVGPDRGPGAIPFEVAYRHTETLAASGGPVEKRFDDRVELRIYLPTVRRTRKP